MMVYSSGPMANVAFYVAAEILKCFAFFSRDIGLGRYIDFFARINLNLAVFNLLPVYPLDGSRLAGELLSERFGLQAGIHYLKKVSFTLSSLIIISGFLLAAYAKEKAGIIGFNLVFAGSYLLFCLKSDFFSEVSVMNLKNMFYRHARFLKKGIYPVRCLVVLDSVRLQSVIKKMDYDRFHIVYVLGKDMRIAAIYTEKELMDLMVVHGGDMSFCDLLLKK